ncbi:MAG: YkgJ family cysteine cluster protein [Deltaproteobacteria bacterium]|nr:YkgJ family cysteine cluster protein [Deltaproteobacteria bacterium]
MIEVFNCRQCGVCCQGEGGIFLEPDQAHGPARLLGLTTSEFVIRYTEPRHGLLSIRTAPNGYCVFHDPEKHLCRIHQAKPEMCRDWPFFFGPLNDPNGFEVAKNNCPGINPEVGWEDFRDWHRAHIGDQPPRSYIPLRRKDT